MAGNVLEWCNDWWVCDLGTTPETDPPGPANTGKKTIRGGSWGAGLDAEMRCSYRPSVWGRYPNEYFGDTGLRVARTADVPATGIGSETAPKLAGIVSVSPNPFNPTTRIQYELDSRVPVSLSVFDVNGRLIKRLVDQTAGPGTFTTEWNGTNESGEHVSTGVYFCRLIAGSFTDTQKMVLLK